MIIKNKNTKKIKKRGLKRIGKDKNIFNYIMLYLIIFNLFIEIESS